MTIEHRLQSLERTVRFQRFALVAVVLAAGVVALAGAAGDKELTVDKLTTKILFIQNDKGEQAAYFGWDDGMPMLVMRDGKGQPRIVAGVSDGKVGANIGIKNTQDKMIWKAP